MPFIGTPIVSDIEPAKVRVLEYLQEKAVFVDQNQRHIKAATLPRHPIAKSMASIGLLAWIIVARYMDGLPLNRLESILKRYGGDVGRTSMANWIIRLSIQCQPLIHLLRDHQHSGPLMQMDETRIQVLKEPGCSATGNKYRWVTLGGPPDKPAVIFDYNPSRSHEVPLRLLDGYNGYLQSDGYAGYDAVSAKLNLTQVGCRDHCRRKLKEAQVAQPGKQQGQSKADIALLKDRLIITDLLFPDSLLVEPLRLFHPTVNSLMLRRPQPKCGLWRHVKP